MLFSRGLLALLPLLQPTAALPQPDQQQSTNLARTGGDSVPQDQPRSIVPPPPQPELATRAHTENSHDHHKQKVEEKKKHYPDAGKYFREPTGGDIEMDHYDIRYFKAKVGYDEHRPTLRHLIRSYLLVFRELGVETWIAHGTLLGWWWNGRIMPWDYDVDVQVSSATLYYLGEHHNRTMHTYSYIDPADGSIHNKTYLLDINPHHIEHTSGDGKNIIDARWIDTSNGMYVDITGLAENSGLWTCKNGHRYRTKDLYPMRESEFEGVPATVPYSFDRILTKEYGSRSLVVTEYMGHRWEPKLKEWI